VCEFAAHAGYDGVEVNGFRPHPHYDDFLGDKDAVELKAQISGYGLGLSGYAPDFHQVPPARVTSGVYLAEIAKALRFCELLQIDVLRVDTVMAPQEVSPGEYEKCFKRLVTSWSEAAERCRKSGVTLVWEFEPGFWLNRPGEVLRLLTAVGHPNFGVLFDSSHAYVGGVRGARQGVDPELVPDVTTYAKCLLGFIRHLHLADSDGSLHDDDTSTHTPLGQGVVDFRALLRALEPIAGVLPWWCVDLCFSDAADVKATEALRYVRWLQRDISVSEEFSR
jgi:sugar phosphate isomerase/epimerase